VFSKKWEKYLPEFIQHQFEKQKSLKKITENIGWLVFDKFLRLGVGLVVGVWIARYLGPFQYGILNYALAFSVLFGTISGLGLDGIVVRELVNNPDMRDEILGTAFVLKAISGIVVLCLSSITISLIKPGDSITIWLVFLSSAGFIFQAFMVIDFYNQACIQSKYTVISLNTSFLVISACKVILILMKAPLITFGIAGLIEVIIGMSLLVLFFNRNSEYFSLKKFSLIRTKSLLKDSWPLILAGFAIIVYMKIDQIMIGDIIGNEAVGIYSSAIKLSEVWYFIPMVITSSIFPAILDAKNKSEKVYYKRLQQLYFLMVWVAILIAIPITFLSEKIIIILYGQAYASAGIVLSIHIWAGIFVFWGVASSQWFLTENLQKYSFYRTVIGAIVNVGLNFILIPIYGVIGAAIATVISQMISSFLSEAFYKKTRISFYMKLNCFGFGIKLKKLEHQ